MVTLPSIHLGALQVRRLICGSNAISGFSHMSAERSQAMLDYFTVANIKAFLASLEQGGIDAIIMRVDNFVMRVLKEYWAEGGSIKWIAQTAPEHRDPFKNISQAQRAGASAVFVHGGVVDRLFGQGESEAVRQQLAHIQKLKLPAGMAAHQPKHLLEAQQAGFPVDFYMVCMYQVGGYQGNQGQEPEENFNDAHRPLALEALRQLKRPCLAYKVMGAGRKRPEEGLRDVVAALRPTDGVIMGMFPEDAENIVQKNVQLFCQMTAPPASGDRSP